MGANDAVTSVENSLPGIRFKVETAVRTKRTALITLRCEVNDKNLYDACVAKLDGLKLFTGDMVEEVLGAFSSALTDNQEELENRERALLHAVQELAEAKAEIARLHSILHNVGIELGIE